MRIEEAFDKLPEYMDGGLTHEERQQMQRLLERDRELGRAFRLSQTLEMALHGQPWLEPSPHFARAVLQRAGVRRASRAPAWAKNWEPAKIWVSLVMAVVIGTWYGGSLGRSALVVLRQTGGWLDGVFGLQMFGSYPIMVLALLAPLAAGAFAACILVGRCRLSS